MPTAHVGGGTIVAANVQKPDEPVNVISICAHHYSGVYHYYSVLRLDVGTGIFLLRGHNVSKKCVIVRTSHRRHQFAYLASSMSFDLMTRT
jgi:hypothetical protein